MTLKHVLDMMYCPLPVQYSDGNLRPSLMLARLEASECHDITVPKCFASLPATWMDWQKQSLDVPLMHEFHIDLINTPSVVGPFEPRRTENLL